MTTAIESPPFADARFEGPKFTGRRAMWALFGAMSGTYTAFFDCEFRRGDLLRTYDGTRYHRMDSVDESYCFVVSVERDHLCKGRPEFDQKGRPWGEAFPFETVLRIIKRDDESNDLKVIENMRKEPEFLRVLR